MADPDPSQIPPELTIAANAVGDKPTYSDSLGFTPYVEAITVFLTSKATHPPLTMSIEGEWGSGKSSFMLQLESMIGGSSKRAKFMEALPRSLGGLNEKGSLLKALKSGFKQRQPIIVQFNAWRHDKQDALWAAFALTFTKSLRKQIGHLRAWKGDFILFCQRLKGFRGWAEFLMFVFCVLSLGIGLKGLYGFVSAHPVAEIRRFISSLSDDPHKSGPQTKQNAEPGNLNTVFEFLLSHGKWGALLLLSGLGFLKLRELKIPLSVDLRKYLAKPDYQGHLAFIENFHEDFSRLIKAYANHQRVFIFIDDLDRCDVPRAAELMQAINLMIGDAGELIFILGMDRDKVAAGITQKYKDLLPYLSEVSNPDLDASTKWMARLSFGYSYLEKFIQLSFTLPVVSDSGPLARFLSSIDARASEAKWSTRITTYWSSKLPRWTNRFRTHGAGTSLAPAHGSPDSERAVSDSQAKARAQEKRIHYLRVKHERDSEEILHSVSMVCPIFENNPRKIKQFMNTFRLSLSLASSQGLLDREETDPAVIPEEPRSTENIRNIRPHQLAKFIALTLRFPELRSKLARPENGKLLAKLEAAAQDTQNTSDLYTGWLNQPGVKQVLLFGLVGDIVAPETYSLNNFPSRALLSILPAVPERTESEKEIAAGFASDTPGSDKLSQEALLSPLELMGKNYEDMRRIEPAGPDRTVHMTELFNKAKARASELASDVARDAGAALIKKDGPGERLIAISLAVAHPDRSWVPWLMGVLDKYRSPFEHYQCIAALSGYETLLSDADYKSILETLNRRWKDIEKDPGRVRQAISLRQRARERMDKGFADGASA